MLEGATKIILGLGNPGARYRETRHNVGQRVVERFAEGRGVRLAVDESTKGGARSAQISIAGDGLLVAVPTTYMNRSGRAAAELLARRDAEPTELLVVYDDADLDLGRLRLRRGGGAGGHNGIRSIIDVIGTDGFPRLKLGVRGSGRAEANLADYVLEAFDTTERGAVDRLVELAVEALDVVVHEGLERAMNRYSGKEAASD